MGDRGVLSRGWSIALGVGLACVCGGMEALAGDFRLGVPSLVGVSSEDPPPPPAEDGEVFKHWKGTVEGGLNGTSGNSETLSFRFGAAAKRTTLRQETTLSTAYSRASDDGRATSHKFEVRARNDWNLGESPWIVFAQGAVEYDQFQSWKWRGTLAGGVGYKFIKDERTTLIGRAGLGLRKNFAGPDQDIIPEGVLGVDFAHQLTERQAITALVEYYPSLKNFPGDYRVLARAGYQLLVDPEVNMFLRLGVENNYLSRPGEGKKKNDLAYFLTLGWSF